MYNWHGFGGNRWALLGSARQVGWRPPPLSRSLLLSAHITPSVPDCFFPAREGLQLGGWGCAFSFWSPSDSSWTSGCSWNFLCLLGHTILSFRHLFSLPIPSHCFLVKVLLICPVAKAPLLCQRQQNAWNSEETLNIEILRNRAMSSKSLPTYKMFLQKLVVWLRF